MEMRDPSSIEALNLSEEQKIERTAQEAVAEENSVTEPETFENPEAEAEEIATEAVEEADTKEQHTKAQLIALARDILAKDGAEIQREGVTRMRQLFNNLRKAEIEAARDKWAADGGAPEAFVLEDDPEEAEFNAIVNEIREKKNAWAAEQEQMRQDNLAAKNEIIEKINALAEDTDNVNRTFPEYRELQDKFNAIGAVPPTEETAIWKRFQEAREHYSDNLKINKELRDYDFKKNLDQKQLLIEEAIALDSEEDIILAFRRLQELHDKWRQIGPVAKELREEIWNKFKDASAAVNKRYQTFFEERKAREAENEAAKTALCEQIETIDFEALKSFADWEQMTAQIIEMQNRWKTLGFASKKVNNALFARFRQRCDEFFTAKAAYFRTVKDEYAANLAKKTALAERAEQLKESTEWRKTTDELIELQKQWKTIGAVPKKYSDAIWRRFVEACDYFFEQKKAATSGQRIAEQANLKAKRAIIEELEAITAEVADSEAAKRMQELQKRWQETGHVPFRDKDKINEAYRQAVNAIRKRLNLNEHRARMDRFEADLSQIEGDQNKMYRERDRLARALENRRREIQTYENNIGFLTSKSRSGESMVAEFTRKIERLRQDIIQIEDKIRLIDSKL